MMRPVMRPIHSEPVSIEATFITEFQDFVTCTLSLYNVVFSAVQFHYTFSHFND